MASIRWQVEVCKFLQKPDGDGKIGRLFPKEGIWHIYDRFPLKHVSKINPQKKEIQFNEESRNRMGPSSGENTPLYLNIGLTHQASLIRQAQRPWPHCSSAQFLKMCGIY